MAWEGLRLMIDDWLLIERQQNIEERVIDTILMVLFSAGMLVTIGLLVCLLW